MDKYSFLNAIHPEQISELYATYLKTPDVVEPSWRAFFQGFDFGMETYNEENAAEQMATYSSNSVASGQVSEKVLKELGLFEIKDIAVGNPLNKKISGGQRKRLNIALELIREPLVLFVARSLAILTVFTGPYFSKNSSSSASSMSAGRPATNNFIKRVIGLVKLGYCNTCWCHLFVKI